MSEPGGPPCIGIVEDEKCLSDIYLKVFSKRGITVSFVARDGLQALELFESANPRPRVLLMDQRIPHMSGVEVTRRILALDSGVRIIFISADSDARDEALKAGAIAFIKKPASLQVITDAVKNA